MTYKALEERLAAKILWAWNDGSPVATSSPEAAAVMASVARRRWSSFEGRRPVKVEGNETDRVEDLARGLCEKFEAGGLKMAGALIDDYRWLAAQLAEVFHSEPLKS